MSAVHCFFLKSFTVAVFDDVSVFLCYIYIIMLDRVNDHRLCIITGCMVSKY